MISSLINSKIKSQDAKNIKEKEEKVKEKKDKGER
jgi:hypothetical protein